MSRKARDGGRPALSRVLPVSSKNVLPGRHTFRSHRWPAAQAPGASSACQRQPPRYQDRRCNRSAPRDRFRRRAPMLESILVPPRGHPVRFRRAATTSGNGLGLSRSRDANAKRTAAARRHASWNLWRLVAEADGHPQDRAERWRDVIGPLFREVWPLDADLRGAATTPTDNWITARPPACPVSPAADMAGSHRDVAEVPQPDSCTATKAPPHSITLSANCWSCHGTSRPKAFAVFILTLSTSLVGNSTGRSPGMAPFRIFSTKSAALRWFSILSIP